MFSSPKATNSIPEGVSSPRSLAQQPRLRILYAVGPGDVVGLYRSLLAGVAPAFQVGMAFSKQFLDWCNESGADAHLISWHPRRDSLEVGRHRVENRPKLSLYYGKGPKHHLGALLYGLNIVAQAIHDRANVVIVDSGTTHWIVLSLLSILRIPVIAVMHSSLWPMGYPPNRRQDRLFRWLDGVFFRRFASATVCVSPECERQVLTLAGTPKGPLFQCRAQYRPQFLDRVTPPSHRDSPPFRVLFLGRIEERKGVFLILSLAERLEAELPSRFKWKIVGSGSAFDELRRQIDVRKLQPILELATPLPDERTALETFGWAHAMIVPTTSAFCEGLAMTAVESTLAGRPVVVSSVVPAWEVLGPAAIKVETGNLDGFVQVFRKLALDPDYYERCQRATLNCRAEFYESSKGLGAILGRAISTIA